ncbi:dodecin domain-containing protein [Phenylobacterium sp. J367]|uniref:dodecin family protein n=1 Tax=Phenylobacterium sp. J367 TaxID=2898435 RepID=UPI0027E2A989|nr:dodecin domain-containing protein [Phenylobacterium sp. J367]
MSVYRVTEIIGTSRNSWEEAAREALAVAADSLRDLRIAEVVEQDIALGADGKIEAFRTKLRVSFKYESDVMRPDRPGVEFGYAHPEPAQ